MKFIYHQTCKRLIAMYIFFVTQPVIAQDNTFQIKGTLTVKNMAIPGATVYLLRAVDTVLIKTDFSTQNGEFIFENLQAGDYRIKTTGIGIVTYHSAVLHLAGNLNLGRIELLQHTNSLQEVTISATKPFVQQQLNKTVLNVAGSISAAGSTALEILEKAPGVTIDQNDNIGMRGRQGVIVMIDGKRVPMTGTELATFLRGTSSNAIDRIDLITNPSAKYDAQGSTGIIDIKLKKDSRIGTNGTLSGSAGQGIYAKAAGGFNLNHRSKKMNYFGSYNFTYRDDVNNLQLYRQFFEQDTTNFTGAYDQDNHFYNEVGSHNYRLGVDYSLSPKATVGIASNNLSTLITTRTAHTSNAYDENDKYISSFLTDGFTHTTRGNHGINLNYRQAFDSTGKALTADLDYARYYNTDNPDIITSYFNSANVNTGADFVLHGDLSGALRIRSAKFDYVQPLKNKGRFEAGVKNSYVSSDNNVEYYDRSDGNNRLDTSKSNRFLYQEHINAAYANLNKVWKRFDVQFGLRSENTLTKALQLKNNSSFRRSYLQLFPSVFVAYTLNEKNKLGASFTRRVNRPTYKQLNPFNIFLDSSSYSAGNPALKSELSNNIELSYTYDEKYIAKISYSRTTDNILNVFSLDPLKTNVVIQTYRNLAINRYYAASVSIPFNAGNWLSSSNNGVIYYNVYKGNLINTNLNKGRTSFNISSVNNIILGRGTSAEVISRYQSADLNGFFNFRPIFVLSSGIQKLLWNKNASIKLNFSDVFYSNNIKVLSVSNGYRENFTQRRDSRVVMFTFNWRFGSGQGSPAKRRDSAEEEKRRAG